MKITKELLEHLKIQSFTLQKDNTDILCFLERIEKNNWTFSLQRTIDFSDCKTLTFQITFSEAFPGDDNTVCTANMDICEYGEDWITVKPVKQDNTRLNAFINVITDMEEKYETFGRRKEERIKIGKENARSFGLAKLEQTVFLPGVHFMQPCVILDASVHGICIITPETSAIKNEDIICIKLALENPVQTIILKAHRVYTRLSKTGDKSFLNISCQLLEPIHFAWKERVIAMIEKVCK